MSLSFDYINVSLTDRTSFISIWTRVQWSVEKQSDTRITTTTTTAAATILCSHLSRVFYLQFKNNQKNLPTSLNFV